MAPGAEDPGVLSPRGIQLSGQAGEAGSGRPGRPRRAARGAAGAGGASAAGLAPVHATMRGAASWSLSLR